MKKQDISLYEVDCSQCGNKLLDANIFCLYKQDANIHDVGGLTYLGPNKAPIFYLVFPKKNKFACLIGPYNPV